MRVNYQTIESENDALKAVEQNGYALQYVKDRAMFKQIAAKFGIETDLD